MAWLVARDRRDDLADLIEMIDERGPARTIEAFAAAEDLPVGL